MARQTSDLDVNRLVQYLKSIEHSPAEEQWLREQSSSRELQDGLWALGHAVFPEHLCHVYAGALPDYVHLKVMGADAEAEDIVVRKYLGIRYSFGYPACPDLSENDKILKLLESEKIGVTTTESHQMVPEQTTAAFIVHHPQARYFTLK